MNFSHETWNNELSDSFYHIKWIKWNNSKFPIITQNENGPCPLIAITNFLILKERFRLSSTAEKISAIDIIQNIANCIIENLPKNIPEDEKLNYEQNMNDAILILPNLSKGLNVNVKFTGIQDFEYTAECTIFDFLNIPLYHAWLIDPQNSEEAKVLQNYSYNQLVEKIVNKNSLDQNMISLALTAENFLERTASQMTYHGLCELNLAMKNYELAVLFRNNHFSTIFKRELVTDQGFLFENDIIWETLSNIDGDGMFVNSDFETVISKGVNYIQELSTKQIEHDYEIAVSLQDDQRRDCKWNGNCIQQKIWDEVTKGKQELAQNPFCDENVTFQKTKFEKNKYLYTFADKKNSCTIL